MTFKTNLKAPKYKLINIDFEKPEAVRIFSFIDVCFTCCVHLHSCKCLCWTECFISESSRD